MRELPYVLTSSYQFLWERIVSIVERNMCLYVYLRNGELILIGAVLLDLSKTFHCIPHDILIAKLNAHGFDRETLKLIYSCLKGRVQSARINNIYSNFLELLSGVSQGSILRAILFNVFLKIYSYSLRKLSYITMLMTIHHLHLPHVIFHMLYC